MILQFKLRKIRIFKDFYMEMEEIEYFIINFDPINKNSVQNLKINFFRYLQYFLIILGNFFLLRVKNSIIG